MAAADKWAREKDDFRKDSGSFCGSCTEWVRRLLWGWWVLFGGRDVRARGEGGVDVRWHTKEAIELMTQTYTWVSR